jgi:hypothetical protein
LKPAGANSSRDPIPTKTGLAGWPCTAKKKKKKRKKEKKKMNAVSLLLKKQQDVLSRMKFKSM